MKKYELMAFVLSPLVPVLLFFIGIIVWQIDTVDKHGYGALFSIAASLAAIGLIVSYSVELLIAVPLYYIGLKANKVSKQFVYLSAMILGALIIAFVWSLFGAHTLNDLLPALAVGAILGISAGFVFWRVINNA